jgi:hypothetical protein
MLKCIPIGKEEIQLFIAGQAVHSCNPSTWEAEEGGSQV